jgi:hemerythrin-like domain-containing protein
MDKGTEEWLAKAKVLKDLVEHHIEEEEGQIHKEAKKRFSKEEAVEIGKDFESLKRELLHFQYQKTA